MACYKVKVTQVEDADDQDWEFTQWWVKGYGVQTGSLHWSDTDDTLYIGFDDGSVQRLKISETGSATEVRPFRRLNSLDVSFLNSGTRTIELRAWLLCQKLTNSSQFPTSAA